MKKSLDGKALVYTGGMYHTPYGKTAHGLVRFTERYQVVGVIDAVSRGRDAGDVLEGKSAAIPIYGDFAEAVRGAGLKPGEGTLVIGVATDGGFLPPGGKAVVREALERGMNVDNGLHEFLGDDEELTALARKNRCRIRDIRKPPPREALHFFTGKINEVGCLKAAVLGTDSAIGKRTTAWIMVHAFRAAGLKAELVGTGQTAWMQGARYAMILDSCVNDFVSGEIEHAVHEAWRNAHPDLIVIEGQGSMMNPAYPGGFEILAAGRPDIVILQHAPSRKDYDGFPGYPIHPLRHQIAAIELVSGRKVAAVTLNHEGMEKEEILPECRRIHGETGIPAFDVLAYGADGLVALLRDQLK